MSLKDIPYVSIVPKDSIDVLFEGERKYLMLKVVDNQQEKTIIIAGRELDMPHMGIIERFRIEIIQDRELKILISGGGRLEFKENVLMVFGGSLNYGRADHEKAAEILKKYFKENNIQIKVKVEPAQ